MSQHTAEEVLAEFQHAYPKRAAEFAHQLWRDICSLPLNLSAYLQLYSSKETVQLLNECAPRFFVWIQNWLRLTIYVEIGRFTDPAESMGRVNVSFLGFAKVLRDAGESSSADQLEKDVVPLQESVKRIRKIRNRELAHADLKTVLREESPLPDVTRKELEDIVEQVGSVFTRTDAKYRHTQTYFKGMDMFTDVDALTAVLRRGVDSFEKERPEALSRVKS